MSQLSAVFESSADEAVGLAIVGEAIFSSTAAGSTVKKEFRLSRLEFLYELAFLRLFMAWEDFLEQSFFRYLCGYRSALGSFPPTKQYASRIAAAEKMVLGNRDYVLWHNPSIIEKRSRSFLLGAPHETVIASNTARLEWFASIRHRVVHGQQDARNKFDIATLRLAGRTYLGARPGRFLRDRVPNHPIVTRWIVEIASEFKNLSRQIVP